MKASGEGIHNSTWDVGAGIWEDDFKDIRRACRFLENVDRCFMDDSLKARYKYEAKALRAYYHMELMMFFGGIPIVTTSVTPLKAILKRSREADVYNWIVNELTDCGNNLPAVYVNADLKRISAGACWALISRLALFYKKYDVAKDAAKKVIDLGVYELYRTASNPARSYADLFLYTGEVNKERIFFRENTSGGNQWNTFAPQGVGGKTVLSPTAAVVNNYETKQGKRSGSWVPIQLPFIKKSPITRKSRSAFGSFCVVAGANLLLLRVESV